MRTTWTYLLKFIISEAALVKELEKKGIGRPSTYANIISTIQDRGYVEVENRTLTPTGKGSSACAFLDKNFNDFIKYNCIFYVMYWLDNRGPQH